MQLRAIDRGARPFARHYATGCYRGLEMTRPAEPRRPPAASNARTETVAEKPMASRSMVASRAATAGRKPQSVTLDRLFHGDKPLSTVAALRVMVHQIDDPREQPNGSTPERHPGDRDYLPPIARAHAPRDQVLVVHADEELRHSGPRRDQLWRYMIPGAAV
jgi:hypothetical protein